MLFSLAKVAVCYLNSLSTSISSRLSSSSKTWYDESKSSFIVRLYINFYFLESLFFVVGYLRWATNIFISFASAYSRTIYSNGVIALTGFDRSLLLRWALCFLTFSNSFSGTCSSDLNWIYEGLDGTIVVIAPLLLWCKIESSSDLEESLADYGSSD